MGDVAEVAEEVPADHRISIRIDAERWAMFDRVRAHISPRKPTAVPITEVLLYCIEHTYQAECAAEPK